MRRVVCLGSRSDMTVGTFRHALLCAYNVAAISNGKLDLDLDAVQRVLEMRLRLFHEPHTFDWCMSELVNLGIAPDRANQILYDFSTAENVTTDLIRELCQDLDLESHLPRLLPR